MRLFLQRGRQHWRIVGIQMVALCLLAVAAAWDFDACLLEVKGLSASFCKRLGHHAQPASDTTACCPLTAKAPITERSSATSCCETSAPSQDALPSAKQYGTGSAIYHAYAEALPLPAAGGNSPLQLKQEMRHERTVFDLKMDMRI